MQEPIQAPVKTPIRSAIFVPKGAGLQLRAPACMEEFSREWQTAGELLKKAHASVARVGGLRLTRDVFGATPKAFPFRLNRNRALGS